jgi:hypothetical protein
MRSYSKINNMLREDDGTATLVEGSAEIIPFPGKQEKEPAIAGVLQQGKLQGKLQRVGGPSDWVPIQLEVEDGERAVSGCQARRVTAKEMGVYLFEPIRVFGRGRWSRSREGRWSLDKFYIDSFEPLDRTPLIEVVAGLRSIRADWSPTPLADMRAHSGADEDL